LIQSEEKKMKSWFAIPLSLIFLFALAACAAAATPQMAEKVVEMEAPAPAATEAVVVMEAPAAPGLAATAAPGGSKGQAVEPALQSPSQGRMIIKDGLMELLVDNPDLAIERVTSLAADQGGYLLSSRVWFSGGYKNAELRMGVPSANFEDTLNQLRRIGVQVLNEQASGQDVSAEYNDLQSQLVNLEATAARVRAFLEQAKTVEESLKINAQLSKLEGEIEQVKGQMKFYEGRAAYSTITVLLQPQRPTPTITPTATATATPTATPAWNPGKTVKSASDTMVNMLQGLVDALIWAVLMLWPFVLVALVVWWLVRQLRRKPPKPAAEGPKPEEGQKP